MTSPEGTSPVRDDRNRSGITTISFVPDGTWPFLPDGFPPMNRCICLACCRHLAGIMGRLVPERSAGKMPAAPYASPPSAAKPIRIGGLLSVVPDGTPGGLRRSQANRRAGPKRKGCPDELQPLHLCVLALDWGSTKSDVSSAWFAYFAVPIAIYFEPPHVGCYASTAPASCLNSGYLLN